MMSQNFRPDTQGWQVVEWFPLRVKHKTFVLSGLVRGELAATTADALAHGGAGCIIFTGRSQPELQSVIDHINRKHPKTKIIFITTDSDKLASMKAAAATIKKLAVPIDGVIGFPTVMAEDYKITSDGIESHFQKNYLGYYVLINSLLETMPAGSRVVLMTTCVHQDAPSPKWEDVNFSDGETYHPLDGYAQSMFANILFTKTLAQSCRDRSIAAFSANPGNTKSNIQTHLSPEEVALWLQRKKDAGENLPILLQQAPRSLSQASATVLRGLLDPDLEEQSGAFLDNCQPLPLAHLDFPAGEQSASALLKLSEGLIEKVGVQKQTDDVKKDGH